MQKFRIVNAPIYHELPNTSSHKQSQGKTIHHFLLDRNYIARIRFRITQVFWYSLQKNGELLTLAV